MVLGTRAVVVLLVVVVIVVVIVVVVIVIVIVVVVVFVVVVVLVVVLVVMFFVVLVAVAVAGHIAPPWYSRTVRLEQMVAAEDPVWIGQSPLELHRTVDWCFDHKAMPAASTRLAVEAERQAYDLAPTSMIGIAGRARCALGGGLPFIRSG